MRDYSSRRGGGIRLESIAMPARLAPRIQSKLLHFVGPAKEAPMKGTPSLPRDTSQWAGWLQVLRQLLPEIALIVLSAYLWYRTGQFRQVPAGDLGPDFWPQVLTALIGLTALVRLVLKVRGIMLLRRADQPQPNVSAQDFARDQDAVEAEGEADEPIHLRKAVIAIALAIGYVLGVIYLGYPLATALFLAVFLRLAGKRSWVGNVVVGIGGALVFSYTFQKIVFISLPTGVGAFDTFTVWLYRLLGIY